MITKEQIDTVNIIYNDLKKLSPILKENPECLTAMVYHVINKIEGFNDWLLYREYLADGNSILKLSPFSAIVGSYEFYNGIPRICTDNTSIDADASYSFMQTFRINWKKHYEVCVDIAENYIKSHYGENSPRDGVDRQMFAEVAKVVKRYLGKGLMNQSRNMMPIMASLLNHLYKGEKKFTYHSVNVAGYVKFCLGFYNIADRLVLLDEFLNRITEYDSCGGYDDPSWMVYGELHKKKYELDDNTKLLEEVIEELQRTIAGMPPIEIAGFIKSYISVIGSSNNKVNLWFTKDVLSNMGIVSQFCIPKQANEITTLTLMVGINGNYLNEYGVTSNDLDAPHEYKPITDDHFTAYLFTGRSRMIPETSLIEKCTSEIVEYYVRKKIN